MNLPSNFWYLTLSIDNCRNFRYDNDIFSGADAFIYCPLQGCSNTCFIFISNFEYSERSRKKKKVFRYQFCILLKKSGKREIE